MPLARPECPDAPTRRLTANRRGAFGTPPRSACFTVSQMSRHLSHGETVAPRGGVSRKSYFKETARLAFPLRLLLTVMFCGFVATLNVPS